MANARLYGFWESLTEALRTGESQNESKGGGNDPHDWDLAQKKALLGKAFAALSKGGAVIVYDAIIDDDRRESAFGLMMSLNMLIETPGGFDYTRKDWVMRL